MSAFRMKHWVKGVLERCKQVTSKIQMPRLIEQVKGRVSLSKLHFMYHTYKFHFLKGFTAVGLLASLSFGGNEYVKMNTNEVIHVLLNGQQVGTISHIQVIDDYIGQRNQALKEKYPDVNLIVEADGIEFEYEKAFLARADDEHTLSVLDTLIVPHAVGTELFIDGKSMGIVKDQETAKEILEGIKSKYAPDNVINGKVRILSLEPEEIIPGESVLESVDFLQKIELIDVDIEPVQVQDPEQLALKLEAGDVQPTQYVVEKGDCISCIAQKLGISKQVIYENNEWIEDDKLQIGDVLDLTVLQPPLTVVTTEKKMVNEEIPFVTEYIEDDTLRKGNMIPISPGKNGMKEVTYEIRKLNGRLDAETIVQENVIIEAVAAVVKKGTKVVLGEGTGKFAWPVVSATITSGYGTRWGKLHKGIDMISKNKEILASDNGKVIAAGTKRDYGNYIIIDHQNGYQTLYGHLSKIYTKVGNIVEKGEKIGYMGSTGDSTGVHLHFEVIVNGSAQNPMKYLNR